MTTLSDNKVNSDVQIVAMDGVDEVWLRFRSLGVHASFTRDQALELGQSLIELCAPALEPVP